MTSRVLDDDEQPTAPINLQPRASVLVAEDDEGFRDIVARRLERDGYEVYLTGSGDAALRMVLGGWPIDSFDVLILDHHMPGRNGLDVLERLRAENDTTPAVIMTAFPDADVLVGARRCGATVLVKPFSLDTLCDATIDAVLVALSLERGAVP